MYQSFGTIEKLKVILIKPCIICDHLIITKYIFFKIIFVFFIKGMRVFPNKEENYNKVPLNFSLDFDPPKRLEYLKIDRLIDCLAVLHLSRHFFANLQFIRSLLIEDACFSKVPNDAFKNMKNLEILGIKNVNSFSHIELKDLFKLKWLRLEINSEEIPLFDHVNPELQVLEFYLRSDLRFNNFESKSNSSSKSFRLNQVFKFHKLKAFLFSGGNNVDFDLDFMHYENVRNTKRFKHENDESNTVNSSSLIYLRLAEIKSLKGSWSSFLNLRTLDLSNNYRVQFQTGMFDGLVNLKSLDISNSCVKLSSDLFNGIINLERLSMRRCNLSRLPDGLFSPLACLKLLDLLSNNIIGLNENTFKGLESLEELRLDYFSSSESLSIDVFTNFGDFKKLILNPISKDLTEQLNAKFSNIQINYY